MSDDGTGAIVESFAATHPYVRLMANPKRITPAAMNIGIAAAQGEVIMRMDAHANYPANYVSMLVHWLEKSGADNVGGQLIMRPSCDTPMVRAIVLAESQMFGVGYTPHRLVASKPRWVDAALYGCFRRQVFERVGLFDEELPRAQDIEFNLRLRRAGGLILLVPDVVSYYSPRDSLPKLWRMQFQNGYFNCAGRSEDGLADNVPLVAATRDPLVVRRFVVGQRAVGAVVQLGAGAVFRHCRPLPHAPCRAFGRCRLPVWRAMWSIPGPGVLGASFRQWSRHAEGYAGFLHPSQTHDASRRAENPDHALNGTILPLLLEWSGVFPAVLDGWVGNGVCFRRRRPRQ